MTVPTLPVIPLPPPLGLFLFLDYGGEALTYALLLIAGAASYGYALFPFYEWISSDCSSKCASLFQFLTTGSRILNVKMFPGLFTKHKSYDLPKGGKNKRWVTREFILFLDRRVENETRIIITFYIIAVTIIVLALSAFFRFIPVHASEMELCLRNDGRSRTLFCYTHESAAYSLPVDCVAHNSMSQKE